MTYEQDRQSAYKCAIAIENSAAELRVGAKSYAVTVLDASRDGYTVRVPNTILNRIRSKTIIRLQFGGELSEVVVESEFADCADFTNVGMKRVRDLTKFKMPSGFQLSFGSMFSLQQDPTLLLGLMIAFLLACFCLPGIGDQIGTAPKVSRAVKGAWSNFEKSVIP
ncbi:MAG: hypothetical protein SFV81_27620 [Pirellulaceae bacterium]|nr:hypothetical protein [Pirellulaceae bacterium]